MFLQKPLKDLFLHKSLCSNLCWDCISGWGWRLGPLRVIGVRNGKNVPRLARTGGARSDLEQSQKGCIQQAPAMNVTRQISQRARVQIENKSEDHLHTLLCMAICHLVGIEFTSKDITTRSKTELKGSPLKFSVMETKSRRCRHLAKFALLVSLVAPRGFERFFTN
eukprot:617436-Amphidinium_carterae.1